MSTIHIPALRLGVPYKSVDQLTTTGATVSQVNSGLIRRDLLGIGKAIEELAAIPTPRLLAICKKAGELFLQGTVPVAMMIVSRRRRTMYARCRRRAVCRMHWCATTWARSPSCSPTW